MKEFHTTKEMYAQKKVLMQYGDLSGTWPTEQKEMIKQMGMNQNDTTIDGDFRESPSLEQRDSRIASSPLHEFIRKGTSVNAKPPENARFERRSTTGLPKNRAQVLA